MSMPIKEDVAMKDYTTMTLVSSLALPNICIHIQPNRLESKEITKIRK